MSDQMWFVVLAPVTYTAAAATRGFIVNCCNALRHVSIERGLWFECIVGILFFQDRHVLGGTHIYLQDTFCSIASQELGELARSNADGVGSRRSCLVDCA
jgi:hypothetical protein